MENSIAVLFEGVNRTTFWSAGLAVSVLGTIALSLTILFSNWTIKTRCFVTAFAVFLVSFGFISLHMTSGYLVLGEPPERMTVLSVDVRDGSVFFWTDDGHKVTIEVDIEGVDPGFLERIRKGLTEHGVVRVEGQTISPGGYFPIPRHRPSGAG